MNRKSYFILLLAFGIITSSANASLFSKKRYSRSMIPSKTVAKPLSEEKKSDINPEEEDKKLREIFAEDAEVTEQEIIATPVVQAPDQNPEPTEIKTFTSTKEYQFSNAEKPAIKLSRNIEKLKPSIVNLSAEQIREVKNIMKSSKASNDMLILEVILAILLPPVAVLIHENEVNVKLLISILLTLFFWLPGVIYALLVVFDKL